MKLLPRRLRVGCALLVLPLVAGAASDPPRPAVTAPQLMLQVGAQQTLDVPGLVRVTVSDPAVADVRTDASHLVVKAMTPGRATLTVWVGEDRTTYEVVVR